MIITKNKFGLLHSFDDQPSLVDNESNKYWHKDGRFHRENDMPSIVMNNGDLYWHINGNLYRDNDNLPSVEMANGNKKFYKKENGISYCYKKINQQEERYMNIKGRLHKENGPAFIGYYKNGKIAYLVYHVNGKLHREDGPAFQSFHKNGNPRKINYYFNNLLHRTNGPAMTSLYKNGKIEHEKYLIEGKISSKLDINNFHGL
jgi:hypothetical protein